jgi:hypothetical protein
MDQYYQTKLAQIQRDLQYVKEQEKLEKDQTKLARRYAHERIYVQNARGALDQQQVEELATLETELITLNRILDDSTQLGICTLSSGTSTKTYDACHASTGYIGWSRLP